jgi:hypothetical protein
MSAANVPGLAEDRAVSRQERGHSDEAGSRPARWVWPASYAVAALLLFLCYLRVSYTAGVTSDGASNALQAWDMLHGNWLLRGWSLSDVSFYTTELPEYVLVEIFRGLGPADVHVSAAITYTLLVVLAGLLAKGGKTGKEGLIRVLIAAGIMIAPQVGPGAFLLLLSPDHTGTGVPLLATFLVLDRAMLAMAPRATTPPGAETASPRRWWWLPPLAGLMLVWAQVGDRLAVTIGVVPIVVVCVVRAYRGIVARREPVSEHWFPIALGAAALVSVGVADAFVAIIRHLGGYVTAPLNTTFAQSATWPAHIALAAEGVLGLYGADVAGRSLGLSTGIALIHLAGLALACWALGRAIRRFFSCDDMIAQILVVAILVNLAAFVFSVLPNTYWDDREIASVLPFGAVLAGRLLADQMTKIRLLPALAVLGCCYIFALGYGDTRPSVQPHDQALTDWLQARHLTAGLGSYAEGNSVTLDSHGTIQVSAPTWRATSVRPGTHEAQASDFNPRAHYANFVVTTMQDGPAFYIPPAWIIHAFGPPAHTYHYESWTIMTWNKNLLTEIG